MVLCPCTKTTWKAHRLLPLPGHKALSAHLQTGKGMLGIHVQWSKAYKLQTIRTGCLEGLPSTAVNLTQDPTTLKHYETARFNNYPNLDCSAVALLDLIIEYGRIQGTLLAVALSIIVHYLFAKRFSWFKSLVIPGVICVSISSAYTLGVISALVLLVIVLLTFLSTHEPKPKNRKVAGR